MDLRTLDATTFARSARRVHERLNDPLHRARLLRAACADTPIIREILEAGYDITRSAGPIAEGTLERMTQDLVTFLALRDIEFDRTGRRPTRTREHKNRSVKSAR